MSDLSVARRYALALYEEAEQAGTLERVDDDMLAVRESLDGSRELEGLFRSPIVSSEKKAAVVKQLFEGRVEPLVVRFLLLLVQKQREDMVPAMIRAYNDLRDERQGVVEALVRTAMPLGDAEEASLKQALEARTGKTVRLQTEVDESLVGGVVVRIGDMVLDGSARHQLQQLRERLAQPHAISLN
jgi:F-type H+-transporting ATPase subunit delta